MTFTTPLFTYAESNISNSIYDFIISIIAIFIMIIAVIIYFSVIFKAVNFIFPNSKKHNQNRY